MIRDPLTLQIDDPIQIASEGNAVLGIRDSGKTYTATWLAERLHDAGIPFIAFDPIGIWRFLRVPGKGKGYPVVVAGGTAGDLPLVPENTAAIVRAAGHAYRHLAGARPLFDGTEQGRLATDRHQCPGHASLREQAPRAPARLHRRGG